MFVTAFATLSLPEGMQKAAPLVPALKSNWLMMHVSIMMLSYSTLIMGSLLSILFLVLTRGKDIQIQGNSLGSKEFLTNEEAGSILRDATIGVLSLEANSSVQIETSSQGQKRLTLLESLDILAIELLD
jgi:ABC-type transport system involved in cytochrome c biogenesis permease subunit